MRSGGGIRTGRGSWPEVSWLGLAWVVGSLADDGDVAMKWNVASLIERYPATFYVLDGICCWPVHCLKRARMRLRKRLRKIVTILFDSLDMKSEELSGYTEASFTTTRNRSWVRHFISQPHSLPFSVSSRLLCHYLVSLPACQDANQVDRYLHIIAPYLSSSAHPVIIIHTP